MNALWCFDATYLIGAVSGESHTAHLCLRINAVYCLRERSSHPRRLSECLQLHGFTESLSTDNQEVSAFPFLMRIQTQNFFFAFQIQRQHRVNGRLFCGDHHSPDFI